MAHITPEESLRGLFYIVKGDYKKKGISFVNKVTGDVNYIGGYDPEDSETTEWYRVQDNITHHCICCGRDFDKCVDAITRIIKHCKTRKQYFKYVCRITSEDYYETHYLGKPPLTPEQRSKKSEGRCPRVSPIMKALNEEVYKVYGDYFRDIVEEAEDSAYRAIKADKPFNKGMKRHKKLPKPVSVQEEETVVETSQTQKPVNSGVKLKRVKKLGKK